MSTTTAMNNAQRRAHNDLARAEKVLIQRIVWDADPAKIAKAEALVIRKHNVWKAVTR